MNVAKVTISLIVMGLFSASLAQGGACVRIGAKTDHGADPHTVKIDKNVEVVSG